MTETSTQAAEGRVTSHQAHGVGWVVFENPKRRNAVSLAMWQQIEGILNRFEGDPQVRVVVMRGAGDQAFVSGADISEFDSQRNDAEAAKRYSTISDQARAAMSAFSKPLVAMIQGVCFGAGVDIALRADVRLAAADAQICIPAARLGIAYAFDSVSLLAGLVGPSVAKDLLFSARRINGHEAQRIGLVNQVCPATDLLATVTEYAQGIARNAPLTLLSAKACVDEGRKDPALRNMGRVEHSIWACFDSADYREGRAAFKEKRLPAFTGR